MNISETTCLVEIFKDNFWLSVASSISYGLGILVSASWICDIWKDFTSSQKVWTIFSILKAWKKVLVSKNLNFTCLLKKLFINTFLMQMSFFLFLIVGLNLLQVWFNPSFDICFLKNLITNATILMLCLSFSFATVLKYLVLAKRSVPEMNEGYVAKVSIFCIILVSWSVSSIKFFIGDTKPTFNQVSENKKLTKNFTLQ